MLKKWLNKEDDEKMQEESEIINDVTKKSGLKSADIVFGIGVLLIIAGVAYMVRQTLIPEVSSSKKQILTEDKDISKSSTNISTSSSPLTEKVQKLSTPPPYAEYSKHNKPWEKENRAKNIRAKIEQSIIKKEQKNIGKKIKSSVASASKVIDIPDIPILEKDHVSKDFICTVQEKYKKFENKEMLYYRAIITKGYTEYVPAFDQEKWNEEGVYLKHQFIVNRIDIANAMVEIIPNKWIPALSFSKCVMIEEK